MHNVARQATIYCAGKGILVLSKKSRESRARKGVYMRTIRVTGKSQIMVRPDMTRITITLEGTYKDYSESLHQSTLGTDRLKEILSGFGFERSDLKTLSFNVDTEYERYKVRSEYKQRLVGYKFRHIMKIEFDSDNERLGKILYALASCELKPEFRLSYTVKDPEAAKNELLGKAVTDAREKAAVLTAAAGVTLKDIQSIDYSWGEIDFEVNPMHRMVIEGACLGAAPASSYDLDIEPDDIEVADTVTVVWEIE